MTSLEFEQAHQPRNDGSLIVSLAGLAISAAKASVSGLGRWHKQRRDRAAFQTLLGKDEWVYRDLGIHRGDVEWASRLPMNVNAALELEKMRNRSLRNW
ncbi:hypothetical protein [Oricola sp.]|uniref:hypothetical protein n=1 Tax=Oricola sp. TaxID=1979950 RepID=UPI000C8EE0D8|nr:hypothetical protein [Ahrensia sp.]|tara:strand:- start:15094 stop:15390 length:297 start_codon:yes stop_codon:yes gene_type:complete